VFYDMVFEGKFARKGFKVGRFEEKVSTFLFSSSRLSFFAELQSVYLEQNRVFKAGQTQLSKVGECLACFSMG